MFCARLNARLRWFVVIGLIASLWVLFYFHSEPGHTTPEDCPVIFQTPELFARAHSYWAETAGANEPSKSLVTLETLDRADSRRAHADHTGHTGESGNRDHTDVRDDTGERVHTERGGAGRLFDDLPVYIINLEKYAARREQTLARVGGLGRVVRAVDGNDVEALKAVFEPEDEASFLGQPHRYVYSRHTCVLGQLGNFLSHLTAMQQAFDDRHELAVVVEDDVNDVMKSLWPVKIRTLVDQANIAYPGWFAIRLQWHDYSDRVDRVWRLWNSQIEEIARKKSNDKLSERWGNWDALTIPLMRPHPSGGWGNMATIWSRVGLEHMLTRYRGQRDESKWRCLPDRPCAADLSFWRDCPKCLITTPPFIAPKFGTTSTLEIRKGVFRGDHKNAHSKLLRKTLLWLASTREIFDNPDFQALNNNASQAATPGG